MSTRKPPRPGVEPLEGRDAPALFTVTTAADNGDNGTPVPGSLRPGRGLERIGESLSDRPCCRGAACCACGRQAATANRSTSPRFAVVLRQRWIALCCR